MLELLRSLTFGSGALLVAVASAVLALVLARVLNLTLSWIFSVAVPFVLAYSLYWSPVWFGANSSEYSSWAPIFIGPWFLAGVGASAMTFSFVRKRKSHVNEPSHG
jgi:hypothetical protein